MESNPAPRIRATLTEGIGQYTTETTSSHQAGGDSKWYHENFVKTKQD